MQMRPYQQAARTAVHREWDEGRNRTLLVLPTGCGKTIVFAKITEDEVRSGNRVLILAHRGELLQQAADKLERTSGLKCAVEKAEQTCLGQWCGQRADPDAAETPCSVPCRLLPDDYH